MTEIRIDGRITRLGCSQQDEKGAVRIYIYVSTTIKPPLSSADP